MADNEKDGAGTSSRGAEWEVVSLSASAFAAAPGPKDFGLADESKEIEESTEHHSSGALFMSGHFVFPPSEHENLPIEPELCEIHNEPEAFHESPFDDDDQVKNYDQQNVEFFYEGSSLAIGDVGFVEGKEFRRLRKEQGMFADFECSGLHDADRSGAQYEPKEPSDESPESPGKPAEENEKNKYDGSSLPCQAWWKRHAAALYHHAKEANTFWSVVVAAAVMGLVILGQRWQREKWQFHQLKWRFSIADEALKKASKV